MLRGVFVTGTDTGVGKTAVSAALVFRYRGIGNICYWKPVQTGVEQDDDTATVRKLAACSDDEYFNRGVRLPQPLSPHLAAKLAGTKISVSEINALASAHSSRCWIVEGAGGALVPLNDKETMADLMTRLGMPAVVVARTTLGTINHTLMTIETLRHRGISVAGIVFVGQPNAANREAVERFGHVATLGEMPLFNPFTPEALCVWAATRLDVSGILSAHL
jgi:dethiobiotin synthase